jgi:hypothetical protein
MVVGYAVRIAVNGGAELLIFVAQAAHSYYLIATSSAVAKDARVLV